MKQSSKTEQTENRELVISSFTERENGAYHHGYDEELLQYELLRDGDLRAVEESRRFFRSINAVHLSDDALRERKYLFVVAATLATRFAIEGGMDQHTAFQLSDLHIRRMDHCAAADEVVRLQENMMRDFTQRMAEIHAEKAAAFAEESGAPTVSKPVRAATEYIYRHLHTRITLQELGDAVSLSPNHLNALFKAQKGVTLQRYIREKKIEAAKNMLLYADFTESEIAEYLAFSGTSHFIRVFRELVGVTPRVFQNQSQPSHARWSGKPI